jgi:O-antigen/teichoic acid export membrane protein
MISAMMLVTALSNLGLGTGLIRYLPAAGDSTRAMLDSSLTFLTIASFVAAVIFLAGLPFWSPSLMFLYQRPIFLVGFVLSAVLFAVSNVVSQIFVAYRAARFTLLCSVILSVLRIPLPILFAARWGAFGVFISLGIAMAGVLAVALVWLLPAVQTGYFPRVRLHVKILDGLIAYSLVNQVAGLLSQASQMILPIIVLNVLGPSASAYSYVVWMLGSVLFMISGALSTSTFAEGANDERALGENVRKSWRLTLLLSVPAILFLLVAGRTLLLLFGREYAENGMGLLTVLALSAIPVGVNNVYIAVKRVTKEMGIVFCISLLVAAGTIWLGCLLMPRYGIIGSGIGWLASQGAVAVYVIGSTVLKRARKPAESRR